MKNDAGTLNELWSKLIIKELIHHGVRTFCISPGSRNSPLTVAAAEHPLAETFIHYDERGSGFHALGYAKGSNQPVALIVTSGSAVGNLLPPIMESYHDQIPLIILTADRPPELRDSGANQTTDQVRIFENFVHWQVDLPCPDQKIPQSYVGTTVMQGVSHALSEPKGPVHFNCPFRKPLLETNHEAPPLSLHQSNRSMHSAQTAISLGRPQIDEKAFEQIADELSEYEKGLILVSRTEPIDDIEKIYALSRYLQWPIFPDILSNVRSGGNGSGVIPYYDLIIKTLGAHEDYAPDAILQFGDHFVSSKLTDWIASKKPKAHCHIASHIKRKDSIHSVTHRVTTDLNHFVEKLPNYLSRSSPSKWLETWKELNQLTKKGVASYFKEHSELSEPHLFHHITEIIAPSSTLFFSNSMSIRNGDTFFCPESPVGKVFGNRGLSGIDGNIATVAGIARGSGKPLIAIIGDLAFLHDLNSLIQLQGLPIKLIVINNNGGDIFSFLPISERKDVFKTYFQTPHDLSLEHAASFFGIDYESPQTIDELDTTLSSPGSAIIEVKTKAGGNKKIHKEISVTLKEIQSRMEAIG